MSRAAGVTVHDGQASRFVSAKISYDQLRQPFAARPDVVDAAWQDLADAAWQDLADLLA